MLYDSIFRQATLITSRLQPSAVLPTPPRERFIRRRKYDSSYKPTPNERHPAQTIINIHIYIYICMYKYGSGSRPKVCNRLGPTLATYPVT